MKKPVLKLLASVCALVFCLAFMLACSSQEPENDYTPPAAEESGGTDGTDNTGSTEGGETEQELRLKYSAACSAIADKIFALNAETNSAATVAAAKMTNPIYKAGAEPEHLPADENDYITVKGVSIYIAMLGDMMNESSFAITDKAVKFTASYTNAGYSENFSATLWYSFDRENNKIYMSWIVDSQTNYGNSDIFLYMDIDYDFSDGSLLSFHIKTLQESTQNTAAFSYKYSDRELTVWHDTQGDYLAYFEPERSALDAMIPDAVNLNADYTAAYTKAMNRMNSAS